MASDLLIDWSPLWLSLRVAALATAVVAVTGLPVAYALERLQFRGKELLDSVLTLPLVLPPTVLGYYLLVLLGRSSPIGHIYEAVLGTPLVFTWQAAVVAAVVHSAPLFIKATRAAFAVIDPRLELAAFSLGASRIRTFLSVTLPLASNQILALAALTFARSMGDFGVTIMLAGNIPGKTQTLSVAIYDAVESGQGQLARVLVVVASAAAILILWPATKLARNYLPEVHR